MFRRKYQRSDFPRGIPSEILNGQADLLWPVSGDGGLIDARMEPAEIRASWGAEPPTGYPDVDGLA